MSPRNSNKIYIPTSVIVVLVEFVLLFEECEVGVFFVDDVVAVATTFVSDDAVCECFAVAGNINELHMISISSTDVLFDDK